MAGAGAYDGVQPLTGRLALHGQQRSPSGQRRNRLGDKESALRYYKVLDRHHFRAMGHHIRSASVQQAIAEQEADEPGLRREKEKTPMGECSHCFSWSWVVC